MPSNDDRSWGIYLNVAGFAQIGHHEEYPPKGHPVNYNFKWEKGRVLDEYQINYITSGSGTFETTEGKYQVQPGTVLFIYPGMWHRYRPYKSSGWNEHFIGFSGLFADNIFHERFNTKGKPIIYIGFQDNIIKHFFEIVELVKDEKPGYQQICSSIVLYLISNIISINKNREFSGRELEKKIRKACIQMRQNINSNINANILAKELNIGYSHFRRMFKKYTGLSPVQYHQSLRISRAKQLLTENNLSIKEIAYELGFNSLFYFSKLFKQKTGTSPSVFRINPFGNKIS